MQDITFDANCEVEASAWTLKSPRTNNLGNSKAQPATASSALSKKTPQCPTQSPHNQCLISSGWKTAWIPPILNPQTILLHQELLFSSGFWTEQSLFWESISWQEVENARKFTLGVLSAWVYWFLQNFAIPKKSWIQFLAWYLDLWFVSKIKNVEDITIAKLKNAGKNITLILGLPCFVLQPSWN